MFDVLGPPLDVGPLLRDERAALLDLLGQLQPEDWTLPTVCPGWTVHDIAVHLVHDDLRRLAAQRDGHPGAWIEARSFDGLVMGLARANERWVAEVAPSLSPRLTCDLLTWLAAPTAEHLTGLPPNDVGDGVAWAGPGPHPNWLDVAREYTERFVHQQQIRDAVGRPGLTLAGFVEPVIDTFLRALPATLPARSMDAEVVVDVGGDVSRAWILRITEDGWRFVPERRDRSATTIRVPPDPFWRRAVRMLDAEGIRTVAEVSGDHTLADAVLDLRAAIVTDVPDHGPV